MKTSIPVLSRATMAKNSVSRRALLSGMLAGIGTYAVGGTRVAAGETTSEQALQGEALEAKPDYTLIAKFATYELELEYGVDEDGKPDATATEMRSAKFEYKCRTWAKDGVVDQNFLGPVLEMRPGEAFKIKIVNELFETGEYAGIGPKEPTASDWFYLINPEEGPSAYLHKLDALGFAMTNVCTPETSLDDIYVDEVNVPKNYNWTNLHTHGLQVTPHLFEPEGTLDEASDYITIKPGEEKTYDFSLPADHPSGTFWYHPHRHNSVAIQAWSGMAGLILVRGTYDDELKSFGITTEIPMAIHDPHYYPDEIPAEGAVGKASIARFLANQNEADNYTFMNTGRYRPNYTLRKNEAVLVRMLTATIENLCGFRIVKKTSDGAPPATDDVNLPFWIIASDGIAYGKPVERRLMVTAGGERHDMLLQFPEPGEYQVWSDRCETIQFFGSGPKQQLLATITVTEETATGQAPIASMIFTPGVTEDKDIQPSEIVRRRHMTFDLEGDTCRFPFPQFKINDRDYRPDESYFDVKAGTAEEWVIINPSAGTHPFHIHVNPYQVKESYSALTVREDLVTDPAERAMVASRIAAMHDIQRPNMWRDTIIVPPKGMLRVWMRFDEKLIGKTVFHCHFLAHEETGMLQNFRIVP